MKVTCNQDQLAKGLSFVSGAVSSRSSMSVLGNVLLATDNGRLRLSATNLELSLTCWIGARIDEEGAITVPAKTMADLVSTLPQDKVEMELVESTNTVNLACGRVKSSVKGIEANEFPVIPSADLDTALPLNVEDLRQMIKQVTFAAATDEARPILTGVLAKLAQSQLTLAASDGFRVAVRTSQLAAPVAQPVEIIIPRRAMDELGKAITAEEPVYLSLPEGRAQVIFRHANYEVVSQLIEGSFPDYERVMPRSYRTRAVLSTVEFRKACKTSDIFAREAAHITRIKVQPGDDLTPGKLSMSASAAETGDNFADLDSTVEGDALEIAFNVRYLLDALNAIETPNVALETSASTSPGVLRPVGREDYTYVIMPMHLGR